jgi:hypothetical protein
LETSLDKYVEKAKETLKKKHVINPKPQKRIMRVISESEESDTEESPKSSRPVVEVLKEKSPQRESLRPIRTAKANANKNLVNNFYFNYIIKFINSTFPNRKRCLQM